MPTSTSEETKILTGTFRHARAKSILTKGSIIPPDRPPPDYLCQAAKAIWKPLFPEGSPLEVITPLDRVAFTQLGHPVASL